MDNLKEFIQAEIITIAFKKVSFDESLIQSKILAVKIISIFILLNLVAIALYIFSGRCPFV